MSDIASGVESGMAESPPDLAPSPQGDSLCEVLVASGNSLMRSISSGNANTQELLNIFWRSSSDWKVRARVFGGLMFSAAGCHTLDFDNLNFNESNNLPSAEEGDKLEMEPQALDPTFTTKYSKFVCQLFKTVPLTEDGILFLRNVAKIVSSMIVNLWDSVRKIGACTGLKLLTFCIKMSANAELQLPDISGDSSSSLSTSYVKKQVETLGKNLDNVIFKRAIRDKCLSIRTLAFEEILVWARHDPLLLLNRDVSNSLKFGLHDKKGCAMYSLTAIEVLFNEDLQDPRQISFFLDIQVALVAHLSSGGGFAIKAMSIMASAVSEISRLRLKLQKSVTSDASDVILFCLYNKYQAVAVDAAKYFYKLNDMEKNDAPEVLRKLSIFHLEASERREHLSDAIDLLIDAFHPILKELVSWEHWEQILSSCENEHTVVVTQMFLVFVKKTTTNYCPRGRVRYGDSLKKKDLLSATNDFTVFLARAWRNIFSLEKIRLCPKALSAFTRAVTFSNASLPSNIAFEMIEALIKLFIENSSEDVLSSACSAISHLYKMVPWDLDLAMNLRSMFESMKNLVVEEFSDVLSLSTLMMGNNSDESTKRILYVIKYIEPYDDFVSLWEKCARELESQCANTNLDVSKVGKILQVLHRILIRQFHTITALPETSSDTSNDDAIANLTGDSDLSESSDLSNQLLCRGHFLQIHSVNFLQNHDSLKMLSFDILVDMVVVFGKHMAGHPKCLMMSDALHPDVEPQLVKVACEATRQTNCKVTSSACCHVLDLVCQLFSEGIFDLTEIGSLLALTGVNEDHDVTIMSAVKAFADRYPAKYMLVAAALASGLNGVILEVFNFAEETDNINDVYQTAVAKLEERFSYWKTMVDFQAILTVQKVHQAFQGLMVDIAKGANYDHLLSTTSAHLFTAYQVDAESVAYESEAATGDSEAAVGDSGAALESDFSLAFADRSMVPHSTPHPSALLAEVSDEPSED